MKKTDIKEGITYQTKTGMAARRVIKITDDRDDAKIHYRWLSPEQGPPFVIYEQTRGREAGRTGALAMASFATWAHSADAGAPDSMPDLRLRIQELEEALKMCRAELLSHHLQYGDKANALDHSAALRAADKLLEKTPS